MLDICFEVASVLSLQFNASKSHCIAFGSQIMLGDTTLCWSSSIKYLGVYLLGGSSLKFDIMPVKRAFYAACNSIFMYLSLIHI